jgi:hypothetical protein
MKSFPFEPVHLFGSLRHLLFENLLWAKEVSFIPEAFEKDMTSSGTTFLRVLKDNLDNISFGFVQLL